MTLEEGCLSLKLECALRELGFVEVHWRVIAHAGLFFVFPACLKDELLGFQIAPERPNFEEFRADYRTLPSAKRALDLALTLS